MSHHVPYFTVEDAVQAFQGGYDTFRQRQRRLRAACGEFAYYPGEHSAEPTCLTCQAWILRDAEEVARIDAGMEP